MSPSGRGRGWSLPASESPAGGRACGRSRGGGLVCGRASPRLAGPEQDWLGAKKIALFNDQYPAAVNDAGECMVPDEVTDGKSIKVALIGQNGVTRIKTNPVLIEQVRA